MGDVAPVLAALPIILEREPNLEQPNWAFSRAMIGPTLFAKFAFSAPTALRIWHEAQMLRVLSDLNLPVPKLVAAGHGAAFLATEFIPAGVPLSYSTVTAAGPDRIDLMAGEIAGFLCRLHSPGTLALAREHVDTLGAPSTSLEVSTEQLRAEFTTMIDPDRRSTVQRWCDWIDEQLTSPADVVLVHGDFHPYNQLWDLATPTLVAVADFESAGLAEPEFDFRTLPVFGPGVGLLTATIRHYEALSGRQLNLERIMALHLLNYLGDALWRTPAGIELPGPGTTPDEYVDGAASRLAALGINP